jgi:hypothetical protein
MLVSNRLGYESKMNYSYVIPIPIKKNITGIAISLISTYFHLRASSRDLLNTIARIFPIKFCDYLFSLTEYSVISLTLSLKI